jgi:hypothetical protein
MCDGVCVNIGIGDNAIRLTGCRPLIATGIGETTRPDTPVVDPADFVTLKDAFARQVDEIAELKIMWERIVLAANPGEAGFGRCMYSYAKSRIPSIKG